MSPLAVAGVAFACMFASTLAAIVGKPALPGHHLSADSKEIVKLGMGMIATLAALVLGLLIASTKGTYDAQGGAVKELAAKVLLLDRVLAKYGPETKDARDLLRSAVVAILDRIWPEDRGRVANLTPGEARAAGEAMYDKIVALAPQNEAQRTLKARALDITSDVAQARLRLFAQQDSSLPLPFLVVLVFWLSVLFAGYGLLAPSNATVLAVLIVCTLSAAAAIFLMLELASPFAGSMRVSSAPLRDAASLIGQ
jgi:hypothetical protein